MRRVHLWLGLLGMLAFLLTGQVMKRHEPPLAEYDSALRLLYRSRHIYLMFAASTNVALGLYLTEANQGAARVLQRVGSGRSLLCEHEVDERAHGVRASCAARIHE